ncbi:MAG TPA: hypothetical protein VJJ22_02065 [Candidatus Paceibacterota bacterium]
MNKAMNLVAVAVLVILGWFGYNALYKNVADFKNLTYTIREEKIALVNGVANTTAGPGSASIITTRFFGKDTRGDVNHDGISDVTFIITQTGGGSGTFYYIASAVSTPAGGREGTNAIFLGDRIVPKSLDILDSNIILEYLDHAQGQDLASRPSVTVSKIFTVENGYLVVPKKIL